MSMKIAKEIGFSEWQLMTNAPDPEIVVKEQKIMEELEKIELEKI